MVHYRVQASPGREEAQGRLLGQLPEAELFVDDGSDVEGWSGITGPWRGYVKCLTDPVGTHLVVIQEDAVLCREFAATCERVAEAHPTVPVCLFVPGVLGETSRLIWRAQRSSKHVCNLAFRDLMPVVAVLWPVEKAQHVLEWASRTDIAGVRRPYASDDAVCGAWRRSTKQTVLCTVPSLVEHPDDIPSTWGSRAKGGMDKGRVAACYIGDSDPLDIDWLA